MPIAVQAVPSFVRLSTLFPTSWATWHRSQAVIHDHLYSTAPVLREIADKVLQQAMKVTGVQSVMHNQLMLVRVSVSHHIMEAHHETIFLGADGTSLNAWADWRRSYVWLELRIA